MKKIPLSKVWISDAMREAIHRAVDSGSYILAKECEAFEAELAAHTGVRHAVLCANWTAGVLLLHKAMGLQPGDEVLVPSHTAFPSIEPMIHCGAKPVFIDIDDTFCLDPALLEAAITPRTVGILPVHLYGHPADLDRVLQVARKHRLWVVEDCAQAQGALWRGNRVGSNAFAGAFSFFPSKNLACLGDGGCITTNDDAVAEKIRMLRNHGRKEKFTHEFVGYNLRFNEIQAAAGRIALRELDRLNAHRRVVAARYRERLSGVVRTPITKPYAEPVYHLFVIRTPRRDALARWLADRGIGTGIHYPVANHRQPAITRLYEDLPTLPRTDEAVGEILSLPIHGAMPLEEVDAVCDAVLSFFQKA